MHARIATWWHEAQQNLWFLPTICTILALGLAIGSLQFDRTQLEGQRGDLVLVFSGGAEGARGVLSAIASGVMTVTGTLFSITIVALQLASSQFTPRVLRSFTGDRTNQLVLGILIGTFSYTLVVLRSIRSPAEDGRGFVPALSVGIAIALALVSVAALIVFIHHISRSIQASVIIDRAAVDTRHLVERQFPEPVGRPVERPPVEPAGPWGRVLADRSGYLQAVDDEQLFSLVEDLAEREHVVLRMEPHMGDFVLTGSVLASLWPAHAVTDELIGSVRQSFVIGPERTLQHDVEFGLRQIADIGIKALSPGINDPTTAMNAVDRLAEILVLMARRAPPAHARKGPSGRIVVLTTMSSFDRALAISVDQMRHYGRNDAVFTAHLLRTLGRVAALAPAEHRPSIHRSIDAVLEGARSALTVSLDKERVEAAAREVHAPESR